MFTRISSSVLYTGIQRTICSLFYRMLKNVYKEYHMGAFDDISKLSENILVALYILDESNKLFYWNTRYAIAFINKIKLWLKNLDKTKYFPSTSNITEFPNFYELVTHVDQNVCTYILEKEVKYLGVYMGRQCNIGLSYKIFHKKHTNNSL